MNEFKGTGNLGANPVLKTVQVGGEDRKVAEMRVFFDRPRSDGAGGYKDEGGFWLSVSVWGDRLAENCAHLLRKGARVECIGELKQSSFTDSETGEERASMQLVADQVYLSLNRIESVTFRPPRDAGADGDTAGN